MTPLRRTILVSALVGCGHAAPPPPIANTRTTPAPTALVQRADAALAASLKPDYGEPFAAAAPDRSAVRALYLQACYAGDHPACWIASAIHPHELDDDPQAEARVIDNCRAGDLMSCRAIRRPVEPVDDLPGHVGRSCWCTWVAMRSGLRCESYRKPCNADVGALRQECAQGFPFSCRAASFLDWRHDPPDLGSRTTALERAGCDRSIEPECSMLTTSKEPARRQALQRLCGLAIDRCRDLGKDAYNEELTSPTDDPIVARDALERLCQFSPVDERAASCAPIIEMYTDGAAPEPAPGRRAALVRWQASHPAPDP